MMTDNEFKKEIGSENSVLIAQRYRIPGANDDNQNICVNCVHAELTLSEYQSAHKICNIGRFIISEKMTCDHFEKIKIVKNAEQK